MPSDFIEAFFPDEREPPPENPERSVLSVSGEQQLSPEQLAEAERIAKELVKLRDAGAISSDPRDPRRLLCAGDPYIRRGVHRQASSAIVPTKIPNP